MPQAPTKILALLFALPLLLAAAPSGELISLPADAYVSLSPIEGWTVQLSAPVVFGSQGAVPSLGVQVSKSFPIGQLLAPAWGDWAERLGLGVGASVFAPLNFQQLYLGASLGLGHSTPIGEHFIDYGLRYAPLVQIDWAANTSTGYNGLLANLGLHLKLAENTWTTLGLQGGFYIPFTGAGREPIWVLQPLLGLNL
ncbi:MAG: hypothetical protein ACAI44_13095 [Candidatus Sericytochromatia bacterium]